MTKVTITKIFRGDAETKFGPRKKVGIKVSEAEVETLSGTKVVATDKWISALFPVTESTPADKWEEGMQVDVGIEAKGDYLNFRFVGKVINSDIGELEEVKIKDATYYRPLKK